MTDKDLLKTVTGFRKGILNGDGPMDKCWIVSAPLQTYLASIGIITALVEVGILVDGQIHNHFILRLPDERIIDATASQFNSRTGKELPEVYIGERPAWYLKLRNGKYSEAKKKVRRLSK